MGCQQSAIDTNNMNNKNPIDLNTVSTNVIVNPYVPFTSKDVFSLKASWKAVKRSMEDTGVFMFTK